MKEVIEKINSIQSGRFCRLDVVLHAWDDDFKFPADLPVKMAGLYWIYTSYTNNAIGQSKLSDLSGAAPIDKCVQWHSELEHICNFTGGRDNQYRVVYNGKAVDLRRRISQEFKGGQGTGALAIGGTSTRNLDKWGFSYVCWHDLPEVFRTQHSYKEFAGTMECAWRAHYGWPILCQK
ncbi:MAG: hypothetical protein HQL19_00915 [Candidatus Omnitrophica bacterium]|nr:hypothetical protein [Candidatus Omnitrophota bacterium]